VNLPFLFLAIVQLSLIEAALVAFASTLVQSLLKTGKAPKLVQVLFNVSTLTTATGLAYLVFHAAWRQGSNGPLSLVLAAGTYFFVNTLPVATIICLTEGAKLVRTWLRIIHLSFPYYVAGTGISSMITGHGRSIGWALPLAVFPVMFGIYGSYQTYFGDSASAVSTDENSIPALARQKAAGAV
jgi:MASE9 protein